MNNLIKLGVIGLLVISAATAQADVYIDGFLQNLQGARLDETNPTTTEMTASETRLQMRAEHFGDGAEFFGRLDFIYDGADMSTYEWELREGYTKFRLGQKVDVKLGRQILTWGTGDLIFINDVFAKDYQSFFVGRDDQYLKAPQDAMRIDAYLGLGDFSLAWTPRFTPNRLPTGRKLSYFNGEQIVGDGNEFIVPVPESKFENGEFAARFSRMFGSFNTALYFYKGFYKNPMGAEIVMIEAIPVPIPLYPRLNIYGASIRGPLAGGILWVEGGYYDSRDDEDGDDPLMPNSQASGMIGFERQVASNLTINAQWLAEYMIDHDIYSGQNEVNGMYVRDEVRHMVTSRITKLLMDELLTLSAFVFYSPTDEDGYARFSARYKYSDELTLTAGGNFFDGNHEATEFGQFQRNDNAYVKVTYGF
ncbi:MAG: hypothetical protein KOO62_10070 [candidate division Zixibacteria bacterium]|nr:hypothetical protein [candidate division Zixibacteria bacterium]